MESCRGPFENRHQTVKLLGFFLRFRLHVFLYVVKDIKIQIAKKTLNPYQSHDIRIQATP